MLESSSKKSNIISDIELMRFVAIVLVMCCHMCGEYNYGWIAVEFFFILAGILMAKSASRILSTKQDVNIGVETKNFILNRAKRVFPFFIIGMMIYPLYYLIRDGLQYTVQNWDLIFIDAPEGATFQMVDAVLNQIPDYFMLMMGGFYVENALVNFATWFISAYFIGLLILFPLYLWKRDASRFVLMPLIFIFCIGFLINTTDSLDVHIPWLTVTYAGVLRAVGEIALGAFCYELGTRLKNVNLTSAGFAFITVMKILLVAILLLWTFKFLPETKGFVMIFIIAAMLIIMYSEQGLKIPSGNKACVFLGAISLPVFLLHSPIQRIFEDTYGQPWIPDHLYIVMPVCILGSLLIYLSVTYIQKHGYWKRFMHIFVAEKEM